MPDDHEQAIAELASEWLRRAQNDLALAQIIDDERIAPEILVYHAQQAAEKAIKALLVKQQIEFPYTHSINTLLSLCQTAGIDVPPSVADTHSLTRYAVAARYPGEAEPITRNEAYQAAQQALTVLRWVQALLG